MTTNYKLIALLKTTVLLFDERENINNEYINSNLVKHFI